MRLEAIKSAIVADFRKYDGVSKKEDAKSANVAKKSDKASLSSEARTAGGVSADIRALSARVAAEPEIRQDKIDSVRAKLQSGYYNSGEFAENLASRLIRDFGFQ